MMEHSFEPNADVAYPDRCHGSVRPFPRARWKRDLPLTPGSDSPLVDERRVECSDAPPPCDTGRQDRLIFGIGFLDTQPAREIELARRPVVIGAEGANVSDDPFD